MGVQGNRNDTDIARKGLLDFDYSDFRKIMAWSELTMEDMKSSIRRATDDTANWANKSAANDLARELNLPYPVLRKRVKMKRRMITGGGKLATARIWYGINDISLKYLKPKQEEGGVFTSGAGIIMRGFISPTLDGHVFKRTGRGRLPIQKQNLSVEHKAWNYLVTTYEPKLSAYFMDRFYFYIESLSGKDFGSAAPALGINPRGLFSDLSSKWMR